MPSARYQIGVSLTKEDWERLRQLQQKRVKVVDVFRKGLNVAEEEVLKNIMD